MHREGVRDVHVRFRGRHCDALGDSGDVRGRCDRRERRRRAVGRQVCVLGLGTRRNVLDGVGRCRTARHADRHERVDDAIGAVTAGEAVEPQLICVGGLQQRTGAVGIDVQDRLQQLVGVRLPSGDRRGGHPEHRWVFGAAAPNRAGPLPEDCQLHDPADTWRVGPHQRSCHLVGRSLDGIRDPEVPGRRLA